MKTLIVMAALVAVTGEAKAQSDDFGVWCDANVEKKIDNRWSASAGVEFRMRDDASEADRWSFGVDISYKIIDGLKVSAGYTLLDDHRHKVNTSGKKYADYWGVRHRINLSLTASSNIGDLSISLRERWQYTYRPEKTVNRYWNYTDEDDDRYYGAFADEHTYGKKAKNVWRQRLQLKYKLTKMWRPYASVETSATNDFEKFRYEIGTEIRLSKEHSLEVGYLYQDIRNNDDDEADSHIISVGYTYKF